MPIFTLSLRESRFLPARRYASEVFAVIVCLSVCPSVRPSVFPSKVGVVPKPLKLKQDHVNNAAQ